MTNGELFDEDAPRVDIASGAVHLRGYVDAIEAELRAAVNAISEAAPFRHMEVPGGHRMSVAMTNCGQVGWVSDRRGYRYDAVDPESGLPWPSMPVPLRALAQRAAADAGYADFLPDACLINRYEPGARMGLHQDRDEPNLTAPIVSVSLGLPATFQFGGLRRTDPIQKVQLRHGDVVVFGGPSRLAYHGVLTLKTGNHPVWGATRINLTFRTAKEHRGFSGPLGRETR